MKRLILAAMMILFATTAHAQKDVTNIYELPFDGPKTEIIQKFIAKGYESTDGILTGAINGADVFVVLSANDNNWVYGISVLFLDTIFSNPQDICKKINIVQDQFCRDRNYLPSPDPELPVVDEDLIYEIKNKKTLEIVDMFFDSICPTCGVATILFGYIEGFGFGLVLELQDFYNTPGYNEEELEEFDDEILDYYRL